MRYDPFDPARHVAPPLAPEDQTDLGRACADLLTGKLSAEDRVALDFRTLERALSDRGAIVRLRPVRLADAPPNPAPSEVDRRDEDEVENATRWRERASRMTARNMAQGRLVLDLYAMAVRLHRAHPSVETERYGQALRALLEAWGVLKAPRTDEDFAAARRYVTHVASAWIPEPWRPARVAVRSQARGDEVQV